MITTLIPRTSAVVLMLLALSACASPPSLFAQETENDVPRGVYAVEWIEPATGRTVSSKKTDHPGGNYTIETPTYTIDIALRMKSSSSTR